MFFLEKSQVEDFQYRLVIAMFLDTVKGDVEITKYIGKNHFKGIVHNTLDIQNAVIKKYGAPLIPDIEQDIYIFNVPDKVPEEGDKGVVFKYMGKPSKRNFTFISIPYSFIDEYKEFSSNPYQFICDNFSRSQWDIRYPNLLYSDTKGVEIILRENGYTEGFFKYKPDPNFSDAIYKRYLENPNGDDCDVSNIRYFIDGLKGTLAFTRPEKLNDPFDCDCEIPYSIAFPNLLALAKDNTKYNPKSIEKLSNNHIERWWKELSEYERTNITDLFNKYADNKVDKKAASSEIERALAKLLFNEKTGKPLDQKQIAGLLQKYTEIRKNLLNMKDDFRILSLTNTPRDILMWGYYGNCDRGVCLNHTVEDLNNGIKNSANAQDCGAGICIYGHMNYEPEKPIYNKKSGEWDVKNIMSFVVDCVFTKYEAWRHENEFRYVLLGGNTRTTNAICINSLLNKCYLGVNAKKVDFYKRLDTDSAWPIEQTKLIQLKKHDTEYRIIDDEHCS